MGEGKLGFGRVANPGNPGSGTMGPRDRAILERRKNRDYLSLLELWKTAIIR